MKKVISSFILISAFSLFATSAKTSLYKGVDLDGSECQINISDFIKTSENLISAQVEINDLKPVKVTNLVYEVHSKKGPFMVIQKDKIGINKLEKQRVVERLEISWDLKNDRPIKYDCLKKSFFDIFSINLSCTLFY